MVACSTRLAARALVAGQLLDAVEVLLRELHGGLGLLHVEPGDLQLVRPRRGLEGRERGLRLASAAVRLLLGRAGDAVVQLDQRVARVHLPAHLAQHLDTTPATGEAMFALPAIWPGPGGLGATVPKPSM